VQATTMNKENAINVFFNKLHRNMIFITSA